MKFFTFFKRNNFVSAFILIAISLALPNSILADYMGSSTYKIQSDSLNFGGVNSSSDNYKLDDTLGEVGTGDSNSANYYMHAGFLQMQESYISISSPTDLVMDSMGGLSGGSSEGTISWQVVTDNTAGYSMSISATTTPALKSTLDQIDDYTPAGADPDFTFTNPADSSSFGFSPEGTEASSRFRDNGLICNAGVLETPSKCWDGLSTTPKVIAGSTTSNMPAGGTVTVRFRAESGANHIQTSGDYNVTITATAVTL
jgi:hypothetical protein